MRDVDALTRECGIFLLELEGEGILNWEKGNGGGGSGRDSGQRPFGLSR